MEETPTFSPPICVRRLSFRSLCLVDISPFSSTFSDLAEDVSSSPFSPGPAMTSF